jgi:hypothetical protein
LLLPAWIIIAWSIVHFAILMATMLPYEIQYNVSSTKETTYSDVIGFYLNSMLTSALVIVGSAELINWFKNGKSNK